jgi:hypothetical protein
MNVMLDEPGILTVLQEMPDACTEVWWGKRLAAARIDLDRVEADKLAELLEDASEQKAPKRLTGSTDSS